MIDKYVCYRIEIELTETIRPLPNKFKELEAYKKKTLQIHNDKILDLDNRLTEFAAEHKEMRANNERDHLRMTKQIHTN